MIQSFPFGQVSTQWTLGISQLLILNF